MRVSIYRMMSLASFLVLSTLSNAVGDFDIIYRDKAIYDFALSRLYDYDLDTAEGTVRALIVRDSLDPKPYFFLTLIQWWRLVGDNYSKSNITAFLRAARKSLDVDETKLRALEDDLEAKFYLGATYGYLAKYYMLSNSLLDAYEFGRKSKNIFDDFVKSDDTLYDAYLAIGTYNCYAGTLPSLLRILVSVAGMGGNTENGIQQLKLAADSGCYARVEALVTLGYVKLELQKDYGQATEIFEGLSKRHESNPVFKLLLAISYRKSGQPGKAIPVCLSCLGDSAVKYVSRNQRASILAELAYCYMLGREYEQAAAQYRLCCSMASDELLVESPWIYYNAGLCEENARHFMKAKTWYLKVLNCGDYFGYHSLARKSLERVEREIGSNRPIDSRQLPK